MSCDFPFRRTLTAFLLTTIVATEAHALEQVDRASFEAFLEQSKLADAERALGGALQAKPDDDEARFALGVVQFLRSVGARMQAFYRHGCRVDPTQTVSFSNLPIPRSQARAARLQDREDCAPSLDQ